MKNQFLMSCLMLMLSVNTVSAGNRVYTIQDAYDAAPKENEAVKFSEDKLIHKESQRANNERAGVALGHLNLIWHLDLSI